MTDEVTFFVPGRPFSKKRARSGQGRTYTPAETVAAETAVRFYAKRAFGDRPPFEGPVSLSCHFSFERAKSTKAAAGDWHAFKPDGDNLEKLIMDALNPLSKNQPPDGWGSAWRDDGQVAVSHRSKTWASDVDPEGTSVTVRAL